MPEETAVTRRERVFFCYSTRDKILVERIYQAVKLRGTFPWIDMFDMELRGSIVQQIGKAIFQSQSIVAFLSRNSVASGWVKYELELAVTREKDERRDLLALVILDDLQRSELPEFLRNKPALRLEGATDEAVGRLAEGIARATEESYPMQGPEGGAAARDKKQVRRIPAGVINHALQRSREYEAFFRLVETIRKPDSTLEVVIQLVNKSFDADATILVQWQNNPGWKQLGSSGRGLPHLSDLSGFMNQYAKLSDLLAGDLGHSSPTAAGDTLVQEALWAPIKRHGLFLGAVGIFRMAETRRREFSTYDGYFVAHIADAIAERFFSRTTWVEALVIDDREEKAAELSRILADGDLRLLFQPIVSAWSRQIAAYDTLISGPEDSSLHDAADLAAWAKKLKRSDRLAETSLRKTLECLDAHRNRLLPGVLVTLKITPALLKPASPLRDTLVGHRAWLKPWCTLLEVTPTGAKLPKLRERAEDLIRAGFAIAAYDPDCIKTDPRWVVDLAPRWIRLPTPADDREWKDLEGFLRIVESCRAVIVADNVRTASDIQRCAKLGIRFFQGRIIHEPSPMPPATFTPASHEIEEVIRSLSNQ